MLNKYFLAPLVALLLLAAAPRLAHAQTTGSVGIGTTAPDASAALEIKSTSQGLLLPRLTLAQRTALTTSTTAPPVAGLVIYQSDNTPGLYAYDGAAWVRLGADDLGNHTATQALNLQANALTGTGADVGTVVGVGVRADGGLNLGQNNGSNLYLGYQAGQANVGGSNNLFSGYYSGYYNTYGSYNLFSGTRSGYSNTQGSYNLFSGHQSGYYNTRGSNNLYFGYQSGYYNTTSNNNLFSGYQSGYYNGYSGVPGAGNNNVFMGYQSGYFNGYSTGGYSSNNVFVGYQSGFSNSAGSNNTALGYGAGPNASNISNSTALGNGALVAADNTIQLGNANITTLNCKVVLTSTSDARFKYDVRADVPGLAFITRLRPVTYRFDDARLNTFERTGTLAPRSAPDSSATIHTGFLAQEVEATARTLGFRFDGIHAPANARDHYGLGYAQFVVPLVQAVQELSSQVTTLQAENATLQARTAQAEADHASLLTLQAQMARLLGEGAQAQK